MGNTKQIANYPKDPQLFKRIVFNSEAETRRNGGVPTDVVFSGGKGVFGSGSYCSFNTGNLGTIHSARGS